MLIRENNPMVLGLVLIVLPGTRAAAEVPAPEQTPAQVIVSGRSSTLKDVTIVPAGDQIPKTFSGKRVKNTPGFSWWVSRHYALKTDYPEKKARAYLTLLELAYPHYVELFGREPAGIKDMRMTVVYASSLDQLKKAFASDGLPQTLHGGGITYEGYNCAYQYPSGTLQYHQRYILLHECTHLYQMCQNGNVFSTPSWYFEGIADSFGHHVYDPSKNQLTVNVLDKATTIDYFDLALALQRRQPISIEEVHKKGAAPRETAFLIIHYFNDDPDRAQKFRIWRDHIFRQKSREESARVLQELFGPWAKLEADFQKWVEARQNTFHYARWGWEQDGNTLWSYGFAGNGEYSQTDVNLIPKQKPAYDPLRMDYPYEEPPPLLGPIARGVAEPSVGCILDFSRNPRHGRVGLGLGVVHGPDPQPGLVKLVIVDENRLLMDGTALGLERKSLPLPDDLRSACAAGKHRIGMTVKIGQSALAVTLRARDPKSAETATFEATLPLAAETRDRLLSRPLAVLARDGYHGVTTFFDDRRQPEPDLLTPAPANRWRNPGDARLFALYKAAWILGAKAPESLRTLKSALLSAVDKGPDAQKEALVTFDKQLSQVLKDVRACGVEATVVEQVRAELERFAP